MKALSILDEVVRELEQDVNVARIKRIVFFACKEFWENDPEQLASTDLGSLIEELCAKYSRLEDIESILNSIVAKVNKKTEYTLVADQIICQLSRLYEYQDFTKLETNISHFGGQEAPAFYGDPFNSELPVESPSERDPGNLFDVRQKILQQTNPLRAKILIFSALYHEFTFSDRDWLLLKTQELDNLLRQLFNVCPTLAELESHLYGTASNLDNTDESDQAASVIIKAMSPCYQKLQLEPYDRAAVSPEADYDQTHLGKNVFEDRPLETHQDYFEAGDITRMTQGTPTHYHYDPRENHLVPDALEVSPQKEPVTSSNSSTRDFKQELEETLLVVETPAIVQSSAAAAPTALNISDSIKQKLGLEEEIKELVSQSANSATGQIEKILSELEAGLNRQFSTESAEERLYWKYKALRDYVGKIQGFTGKLTEILRELELKESGGSALEMQPNAAENVSATEPRSDSSDRGYQQQLVAMAKQGNPKAIAALIDRVLQPKGITATAGFKDGWLHVILESAQRPNQQDTATYIYKKLCTLKSQFFNKVKIHGRQSGNKTVAWTQEFVNKTN